MVQQLDIDGVLITWGDRLFYPGNRMVKGATPPRLSGEATRQQAAAIRRRIEAIVLHRVPQVMVKVTGGGRGMKAIAAHFRYISKNGRLELEDQRGETMRGKEALRYLGDEWRFGGSLIPDCAEPFHRREALNIMLSMPRGTDATSVHWAAREFAKSELVDHKYVMVLHDHQANPHVHISVRAESLQGRRLNPRKADLQRWRDTFAARLRERGIEADATRQSTRGASRHHPDLWQLKAYGDGRLLRPLVPRMLGALGQAGLEAAQQTWRQLAMAIDAVGGEADRRLARSIEAYVSDIARRPAVALEPMFNPAPSPECSDRIR